MRQSHQVIAAILLTGLAALITVGCTGAGVGTGGGQSLSGSVHGGQSPVTGSTVKLYAAGIGSSGASVLATSVTDASGSFILSNYTCPTPTTQIYITTSEGNPSLANGTNNTALKMMAALGGCADSPSIININEVTTVAAAYALNGFIGANGCVDCSGGGAPIAVSNVHGKNPGLSNAFQTAFKLASVTTGKAGPALAAGANVATQQKLNSFANALAACVNTADGNSSQCVELFACATPGASYSGSACSGGSGTPIDTLQAILSITRNPGAVPMAGVHEVATRNVVFSPTLSAAPNDGTLMLNFTGGGLNSPRSIAIDASGKVWVANFNNSSISKFNASGTAVSPASGFTGGGLNLPIAIAIDASGNVWAANNVNDSLTELVGAAAPTRTPLVATLTQGFAP